MKNYFLILFLFFLSLSVHSQTGHTGVTSQKMQEIYNEVKTPYKYGMVIVPEDDSKKIDCPTVFRKGKFWYMSYIMFDGKGYETWLSRSKDLLNWKTLGRILSFSKDTSRWDAYQKAGYLSLIDTEWGGSYKLQKYKNKYWLSYFGGKEKGYEAGLLSIGIAFTKKDATKAHEWQSLSKPVFTALDSDVRWWENKKLFKSTVILDKTKTTGYPFVMYCISFLQCCK